MKFVLPICCLVTSVTALIISVLGLLSAAVSGLFALFGVFAIVIVLIGFTLAVINCGLSFSLVKSKLCLASGIVSAIALFVSIASLIVLI